MIQLLRHQTQQLLIPNRIPFRYGIAVMTEVPHLIVIADWKIDEAVVQGISSENLPPKWFTKIPSKSIDQEIEEMLEVIAFAFQEATKIHARTAFDFWHTLHTQAEREASHRGAGMLLMGLGVSLVERTLLDAISLHRKETLSSLVQKNRLGIQLSQLHPELGASAPSDWLSKDPLSSVTLRQTIGFSDPLTSLDSPVRLNDGLPENLEELIRAYGLHEFKIKLKGDLSEDLARLRQIFELLDSTATQRMPPWKFSLDGNENFSDAKTFRAFWRELIDDSNIQAHLSQLLFVEQPIHREQALLDSATWTDWKEAPPLLIDESDTGPESVRRALRLGYIGVSHKNCKGIFRGIANACLLESRRRQFPKTNLKMSGEDLANTGPIALTQDLAVQALLGNSSVERNGHYYFHGFSAWPLEIQKAALQDYPLLLTSLSTGAPTLRINEGRINLTDLHPEGAGAAGRATRLKIPLTTTA